MGDTGWLSQPKLMSPVLLDATAVALRDLREHQNEPFAVVLHGGEPLLMGKQRLEDALRRLRQHIPSDCPIDIQTNGTLLSPGILDVCAAQGARISISIDGPESVNDQHRIGHSGQPSHARIVRGIEFIRQHRQSSLLYSGLLAVIDPTSDPAEVYRYLKTLDPPSIDFLVRDGNRTRLPPGKSTIDSIEYGHWLSRLLDVYVEDDNPPRIRILDDLLRLMLGGQSTKEGIGLTDFGIIVIETDGTIAKNDTLKSSKDGADRFDEHWNVKDSSLVEIVQLDNFLDYHNQQRPTSRTCLSCNFLRICGGGMPLHRWSDEGGFDNPSVYCADQKHLITHASKVIAAAISH